MYFQVVRIELLKVGRNKINIVRLMFGWKYGEKETCESERLIDQYIEEDHRHLL